MFTFLAAIILLIVGYLTYGKFVEKVFGVNENNVCPAYAKQDGVDYVPMEWKRASLVQLLNIAGLGPIFGPIMGALWGPVAFLWIVLGSIFAGAVHDYFSGMLSVRNGGAGLPDIVGKYLGKGMKAFTNVFALVLLVLVGTVFMTGPAKLLASLTPGWMTLSVWVGIILLYYVLATLLPVDKIIGRVYPFFGALLLIMAFGVAGALLVQGYHIPELTLANMHPKGSPIWPLLFITIACGAISGFHATQSPIIARCTQNEKYGRKIFYGMMIAEGIIALIWAAAGMSFYGSYEGLAAVLAPGGPGPAGVVKEVATTMLGAVGGTMAVLGVIVLPITSGDTAFRGARMLIADFLKMDQKPFAKRLAIAVPLFTVGYLLTLIDFNFLWRYFAWANQTTAMIMLWAAAVYLAQERKLYWVAAVPASFMTVVTFTYILMAPEGFKLATGIAYPLGFALALLPIGLFVKQVLGMNKGTLVADPAKNS
ncbi:carbon starvation protein A [Desulforamulus hydrothermalis]|uniref:Carbon starvation protein CstA n=1 Tax=Desulforamulus hydrothermalis Lam5 = DSM 18033 TaxID=1121428 RepID=K8EFR2_9FIRM|nr:carbon starvation protein A [Desulforamulus hydrothermalis]CCO07531.1 Carbon starvation protein CstA [Desulforamulus hydrothermalis Lam5 = DSM 18033]SHH30745.1 Carbon starvation protein CstA [Desulforamulus hydrothermalis Lam5 = DSM 18033]